MSDNKDVAATQETASSPSSETGSQCSSPFPQGAEMAPPEDTTGFPEPAGDLQADTRDGGGEAEKEGSPVAGEGIPQNGAALPSSLRNSDGIVAPGTTVPAEASSEALPSIDGEHSPVAPEEENEEDDEDEDGDYGRMSLMDHLRELRRRLVFCVIAAFIGFLACWAVIEPIFNVLTEPLLAVLPAGSTAMYTTLPEGFFTRMYIAFITGLFVVSPYVFYQIWAFISPGLYAEEKKFIIPIAIVSALFFVGGGLFCYYIVFKYAFSFFVSFATEKIVAMPKISDYLDFVIKLILAFGLIFEMPIFSFFLSRMGAVTAADMRRVRRYAVLVVFIVAAILTPPDVVSQLLMAVPMLILYEVSILVAVIFGRKKKAVPADGSEEDEEAYEASDASSSAATAPATQAGAGKDARYSESEPHPADAPDSGQVQNDASSVPSHQEPASVADASDKPGGQGEKKHE